MIEVVPEEIISEIANHLRQRSLEGENGWESCQADEDALTGHLFGILERRWWSKTRYANKRHWRWRCTSYKFKGRGRGAEESIIGADGIIQIGVEDIEAGAIITKGVLFQAKKFGARKDSELLTQVTKMEKLIPNCSAVFEFGPEEYRAFDGSAIIQAAGRIPDSIIAVRNRLGDYLADRFLICKAGIRGMFLEGQPRTLVVPHETYGVKRYRADLKRRLRIEVQKS